MTRSIVVVVITITTIIGCGIPQIQYLAPPTGNNSVDNGTFIFFHNTDNDIDQFLGYDIYYKFYDNMSTTTTCVDDKEYIESVPTVLSDQRLVARSYTRIVLDDEDQDIPTVSIASGAKSTRHRFVVRLADALALSIADAENSTLVNTTDNTVYRMYRRVQDNTQNNEYKPLHAYVPATIFFASDGDMRAAAISSAELSAVIERTNDRLHIAFYGIAFGLGDSFQVIRSEPEFLGYLSMQRTPSQAHPCNS